MKSAVHGEEAPLSDEEIEAILAQENAQPPESEASAPQPHLVESHGSAASWVKWIMLLALASELLLGLFRK